MDKATQIKEVLPTASVTEDKAMNEISAFISEATADQLTKLLKLGLKRIKRSGAGISIKFNK